MRRAILAFVMVAIVAAAHPAGAIDDGFGAGIGSLRSMTPAGPLVLGIGSASGMSVRESAHTTALLQARAGLSGMYMENDSHGNDRVFLDSSCDTTDAQVRRSGSVMGQSAEASVYASCPSGEMYPDLSLARRGPRRSMRGLAP